jgi:putative SOS response-associated peptidase YedK
MCGRYGLSRKDSFAEYFEVDPFDDFEPRYNIAPTQPVPVVRQVGPTRVLSQMRWGLIPSWARDGSMSASLINARSETVLEKPAFRDSFRLRRCLIPADGFYEWKRSGNAKQPFHFGMRDDAPFAFAGIWDRWRSPGGEMIESCSILTITPNELLMDVHDRMPVILPRERHQAWLTSPDTWTGALRGMLVPFDATWMKGHQVSTLVNRPENDSPACAAEAQLVHTNLELWT